MQIIIVRTTAYCAGFYINSFPFDRVIETKEIFF